MAKERHVASSQEHTEQGNSPSTSFQLIEGEYATVSSHVGSLRLVNADGKSVTVVEKAALQTERDVTYRNASTGERVTKRETVWRFKRDRRLPMPRQAAGRDELLQAINDFADNLVEFDRADTFLTPDGRERSKAFKVVVNSKGEPISVEQYIRGLLVDAFTLANQKIMQSALRDKAEQELRSELGIAEPDKKVRVKKAASGLVEDDDVDAE